MIGQFQLVTSSVERQRVEAPPHEVHLWGFLLAVDDREASSLAHCLAPDERARAERLVSVQHRQEYIAAHSVLRMVLSRYCDQRPEELRFFRSDSGKPYLHDSQSLRFNLTHSHGRALIAVANGREVGVDLEAVRPQIDIMKLAKRFLSSQDVRFIVDAEPPRRHERFLQIWVAREAVAKAEGTGIRFPLDQDHVELTKDATEGHLIRHGRKQPVLIRFLALEAGWTGAVAAEGTDWRVVWR